MKYKNLGNTKLKVSNICLGTMTFGEQNSKKDSLKIMDFAFEKGINFFIFELLFYLLGHVAFFEVQHFNLIYFCNQIS